MSSILTLATGHFCDVHNILELILGPHTRFVYFPKRTYSTFLMRIIFPFSINYQHHVHSASQQQEMIR